MALLRSGPLCQPDNFLGRPLLRQNLDCIQQSPPNGPDSVLVACRPLGCPRNHLHLFRSGPFHNDF